MRFYRLEVSTEIDVQKCELVYILGIFITISIWTESQVARVRQECEETENTLRERIQRLEMSRLELEEEISRLKNSNMVEKIHHEEQLSLAKQKIQADEVTMNFVFYQHGFIFKVTTVLYSIYTVHVYVMNGFLDVVNVCF